MGKMRNFKVKFPKVINKHLTVDEGQTPRLCCWTEIDTCKVDHVTAFPTASFQLENANTVHRKGTATITFVP